MDFVLQEMWLVRTNFLAFVIVSFHIVSVEDAFLICFFWNVIEYRSEGECISPFIPHHIRYHNTECWKNGYTKKKNEFYKEIKLGRNGITKERQKFQDFSIRFITYKGIYFIGARMNQISSSFIFLFFISSKHGDFQVA